jgi:hypothetical protein
MQALVSAAASDSAAQFPLIQFEKGIPIFELLVVGTSGSGKTIFLSALGEQLSVLGKNGFILKSANADQAGFLRNHYDAVRNPQRPWPPPTIGDTVYEFTGVSPKQPNDENALFRCRYTDFSGESVTAPKAEEFDVQEALHKSHTIIFLVDGIKLIYKHLRRSFEPLLSLDDELNVLSAYAQSCIERPIQFALTKWDVVKQHMSLEQARKHLEENPKFHSIQDQLVKRQRPIHIVPVSAVGDEFASFDVEKNEMKKRPGAAARPYHVDVSLALAITDSLFQAFRESISRQQKFKRIAFQTLSYGGVPAQWVLRVLMIAQDDAWIVRIAAVLDRALDAFGKNTNQALRKLDDRIEKAKTRNAILDAIIEKQQLIVADFLMGHPSARPQAAVQG